MQMISGGGLIGSKEEENWKRAADGFYRIVKQAEKLGITILLEADFTCTVKNTADACRMLDLLPISSAYKEPLKRLRLLKLFHNIAGSVPLQPHLLWPC